MIEEFERLIANYFGSKYAVSVDCCTHGIELCLRLLKSDNVTCPDKTYLSIPMTFEKLNLSWEFTNETWENYYYVGNTNIIDAAVYWKENGYIKDTYMCISFQFRKHLSLGRGGIILLDNLENYQKLKKMRWDGRIDNVQWQKQDIDSIGYHYYMTPEIASEGLKKFQIAKDIPAKVWTSDDYIDLRTLTLFKNKA